MLFRSGKFCHFYYRQPISFNFLFLIVPGKKALMLFSLRVRNLKKMLGKNKYFATELQEVQGKERDDIKISQGTSNVSPNEGQKKKKNTRFVIYVSEEDAKIK